MMRACIEESDSQGSKLRPIELSPHMSRWATESALLPLRHQEVKVEFRS